MALVAKKPSANAGDIRDVDSIRKIAVCTCDYIRQMQAKPLSP